MARPLEMSISLNVLEHLGMNLYSNVPAVLSEIVANSWDADAQNVTVTIEKSQKRIMIEDDGAGMTRDEVIDQFLEVGFQRRTILGANTAKLGRPPMGRKGIGKLSSFSVAQVVTVYTVKDGEKTAFRMDSGKIKKRAERRDSDPYQPEELATDRHNWPKELKRGTRIVLSGLKRKITTLTEQGLRQRLARRFSVIGSEADFAVRVNDQKISPGDRGYYEHVEYLWTYGNQTDLLPLFSNLSQEHPSVDRSLEVSNSRITVTGWIGTVKRPESLKSEDKENLNNLAVFVRGKLAQEDMLKPFGEKQIYADYIVGELHCDDLDQDDGEDIATTSRQAIKADDPRFEALQETVQNELKNIAKHWGEWRRGDGAKKLVREVPAVSDWLSQLTGDTQKKAERWIGRLNTMRIGEDVDRKDILKASILAFETYKCKEQLDFLDNLEDREFKSLLPVFKDIEDLEKSYYGQIVKFRIGVINKLREKLEADEKERVLQRYIFDHLWLLDPSWERVKGTEALESRVTKFLKGTSGKLTKKEKSARIDIGYRTSSGKHVIIEMKRGSVATPVDTLTGQIRKYRNGARKILEKSDYSGWPLDIICLVGEPPPEWHENQGPIEVRNSLQQVDARLVFYDELLDNSTKAYTDYIEAHKKVDRLWGIFDSIEEYDPNKNRG